MAQRIGPPGSARIAVGGNHMGHAYANVFWTNLGGGATASQADFNAYVSAFYDQYYNTWSTQFSNQTTIDLCSGVLFQSPTTVLHSVRAQQNAGLISAPFVQDASACIVLSWTSNAYWRGGKPRTYLPGVSVGYAANSYSITQSGDDNFTTKGNAFHAAINGLASGGITSSQHGFVKFFSQGQLLNPGVFYPITGCQVHKRFGTQRRRLGPWTQ